MMLKLRQGWLKTNPRWYALTRKNHYSLKWRSLIKLLYTNMQEVLNLILY